MSECQRVSCTTYRQEMILLELRRRLARGEITPEERRRIETDIRELEAAMGMD